MAYSDWNDYLIQKFFYSSHEGDVITLRVSKDWFENIAALDGMGGYQDFINCMAQPCDKAPYGNNVCRNLEYMIEWHSKRLGSEPLSEPLYVAYYALLCLPWTESENCATYYQHLAQNDNHGVNYGDIEQGNGIARYDLTDGFNLLAEWAQTNKKVQGRFCFARMHGNENNVVSYFLSQVLMPNEVISSLPDQVFRHMPRRAFSLDEASEFWGQIDNANRFRVTIRNVLLERNQLAGQGLRGELIRLLFDEYCKWVDNGRPLPRRERRTNDGHGRWNGRSVQERASLVPRIYLTVTGTRDANGEIRWGRRLQVKCPGGAPSWLDLQNLRVGGHLARGTMTNCGTIDVRAEDNSVDPLWSALANSALQGDTPDKDWRGPDDSDSFTFSQGKCFVMTYSEDCWSFVQQDRPAPEVEFYLVYNNGYDEIRSNVNNWLHRFNIDHEILALDSQDWSFVHVRQGCSARAIAMIPDGYSADEPSSTWGFVGGMTTEREYSRVTYFPDDLPEIEAYLPNDPELYRITLSVLPRDQADRVECVPSGAVLDDRNATRPETEYTKKRFKIRMPLETSVYQIGVTLYKRSTPDSNFMQIEPEKTFRIHSFGANADVGANRAMDKFGEIVSSTDAQYWPNTDENVVPETQPGQAAEPQVFYDDLDLIREKWNDYWEFIEKLRAINTRCGIDGGDMWRLAYRYFAGEDWKKRLLDLSYLGCVDINTNRVGYWTRFFPVLPVGWTTLSSQSGYETAMLTGSFSIGDVERAFDAIDANSQIEVSAHYIAAGKSSSMLPPRVVVKCSNASLGEFIRRTNLQGLGCLSAKYADLAATVGDWYDTIRRFARTGIPRDNEVEGWFSFPDYRMDTSAEPQATNPWDRYQGIISELFPSCMCARSNVYCPGNSFYDLVSRRDGITVAVKDRAWAKWSSYQLAQQGLFFRIPYVSSSSSLLLPYELRLPKVMARAAVLGSGFVPIKVDSSSPYDRGAPGQSDYGLTFRPNQYHGGKVLEFRGVPRSVAETIAGKLGACLGDFTR